VVRRSSVAVRGPQAGNSLGIEALVPDLGVFTCNYVRSNTKQVKEAEAAGLSVIREIAGCL
jgi:hypothetical protein